MKLLIILASPGPLVGGMEKQVALQADYLSRISAMQVAVIAAPAYASLFVEGVSFSSVDMSRSRRNPSLLLALFKIIRQFQPDIIHAHGHKAASLLSSIRYFIGRNNHHNIKLIGTSHGVKRNNNALKRMDKIFVVSQGVQSAVMPLPSIIVANGIEPCANTRTSVSSTLTKFEFCQSFDLDASLPLILGVGRLVKLKHFELLMKAGAELNANIVILGDGPEHENLTKLTRKNVTLAGHREDIRSILPIADLMVICSDREGFSLALIEALHSKLPVLSTPVPGAQDLLPDECLIKSTEQTELIGFIQQHLLNLEQLKKNLSSQFDFVRKELRIESVAERTHALYCDALNNRS